MSDIGGSDEKCRDGASSKLELLGMVAGRGRLEGFG